MHLPPSYHRHLEAEQDGRPQHSRDHRFGGHFPTGQDLCSERWGLNGRFRYCTLAAFFFVVPLTHKYTRTWIRTQHAHTYTPTHTYTHLMIYNTNTTHLHTNTHTTAVNNPYRHMPGEPAVLAKVLTKDHKPDDPSETLLVESLGKKTTFKAVLQLFTKKTSHFPLVSRGTCGD